MHTDAGIFEADAAIVTVPLGVLKRPGQLRFQPPLPPRKQAAIQRLGFGCLNKVMMLFPHCFWGDKVSAPVVVAEDVLTCCRSVLKPARSLGLGV